MVGYRWTKSRKRVTEKLTWSDDNNMYLGPVVAAQQVLDPSPQHTNLQEEKKGGAHPLEPSFQETIPGSRY